MMVVRRACARCLRFREHLVRVASMVFGMYVHRSLCVSCVLEVLKSAAERMSL